MNKAQRTSILECAEKFRGISSDSAYTAQIEAQQALQKIDPVLLKEAAFPHLDNHENIQPFAQQGIMTAGGGSGKLAFTIAQAEEFFAQNEQYIFVHPNPTPQFDTVMKNAAAVVISAGTSSHAVRQTKMSGVPCCCGVAGIEGGLLKIGEREFRYGDVISVDGTGFYDCTFERIPSIPSQDTLPIAQFCADILKEHNTIAALTHSQADIDNALAQNVAAIVLLTEYSFEETRDRAALLEVMLESHHNKSNVLDDRARAAIAEKYSNGDGLTTAETDLLSTMTTSFSHALESIAKAPSSPSLTIRLIDPSADELITPPVINALEVDSGISSAALLPLRQDEPSIAIRGYRLFAEYPETYALQIVSFFRALKELPPEETQKLKKVTLMSPMITNAAEFKDIAEFIATVATQMGVKRDQYDLACMLEIPAACKDFTIQEIIESQAPYPVHFSFGTNDLTAGESSLGRTSAKYITTQVARGVFSDDYAQKLTPAVEHDIAVVSGVVKSANTDRPEEEQIHLGICGSHGSYHPNLPFLQKNLDYIAVTPPELTAASVAAAQNQILLNQARDRAIWAVNVGSYTQ